MEEDQTQCLAAGFELYFYSKATTEATSRFEKTMLWLELNELTKVKDSANSPIKSACLDSEVCAALIEIDLNTLQLDQEARHHLSFIELDASRSLWLELAISPQKLLEVEEDDLHELDFE